jgi:hypothetical protein
VPCALPLPACATLDSSQQPAQQAGQVAVSKLQPQHPSTADILLGWMSATHHISRPRVWPKQAAGGCGAEAPVKKRRSAAVARAERNTPRVSIQRKPLCALSGAAAAEMDQTAAAYRLGAGKDGGAAVLAPAAPGEVVAGADAPATAAAAAAAAAAPAAGAAADAEAEQHLASQGAADSEGSEPAIWDDSCPGQLSPGSLLIEVPVCVPEQAIEPLNAQYLREALSAAQTVLDAAPEDDQLLDRLAASGAASDAELMAARAAGSMGGNLGWDASWGNLDLQQSQGARHPAKVTGAVVDTAWCTPAVLDILTGAPLLAVDTAAVNNRQQQQQQQQHSGAAAAGQAPHSPQNQQQPQQHRTASLGAQLLEQLVAADMQLGDERSSLMLPVVLFADSVSAWTSAASGDAAAAGPSLCAELRAQCGYKRQSTAHLELYFDWSLLQPQQQLYSSSCRKRDSSCLLGLLGAKRLKTAAGEAIAAVSLQEQGQQERDPLRWLLMLKQHPGLQQLQQDLSKKQPTAPPAAAKTPGDGAGRASAAQLVQSLSRQVYAAYNLQQPCAPDTAGKAPAPAAADVAQPPAAHPDAKAGSAIETVPAEVAAAAGAWHLAQERSRSMPAVSGMHAETAGAAAAGAAATLTARPLAAAAASDLDFFMHLQGQHTQRNKRRDTLVLQVPALGCKAGGPVGAQQMDQRDTAVPAVQQVSLSPAAAAPAKRARMSTMQQQQLNAQGVPKARADCQEQEDARQQRQQNAVLATADLALNGAMTGAAAQQMAEAAAAAAGPSVITVSVPGSILQLLLQLDSMRRSVLSAMQHPGPELVDSLLWDDSTAQQQLLQLKAQQQQQQQQQKSRQVPSAQQRQHNKQLVVLVLLSQTAACLVHYGVRVAHMFLQHGLQRLPSILEACRPALVALSTASDALEHLPATLAAAGASTGLMQSALIPAAREHPKLARLKDLVLRLKHAQPVST